MSHNSNHRPVIVAAITASLLMFVFGLTYRILAARLDAPVGKTPIDPAILERFPAQIGDWTGQDVPLDEATVRATGTDAHINRVYSRGNGLESVSLYVASGVKVYELVGHRPEVCYIGAGWRLVDRCAVELPLNDGTKLPCSVLQFCRFGLDTRRLTALNYFIMDGRYYGDFSAVLSKAERRFAAVGYAVQVQIVTSTEPLTIDPATRLVCDFAVDSASSIARLFGDLEKDRSSGEVGTPLKGK